MGLREHARVRPTGPERFRKEYSRSFLHAVHAVLFEAGKRLKRRTLEGFDEVAITGQLVRELNLVVESPKAPTGGFLLSVHDDPPVDANEKIGKTRPRVDIQVEKVSPGPRVRFSFEAKRLRLEPNKALAAYVGKDGMGCFVRGSYAARAPWGGMLAYVESGAVEDWIASVGDKIPRVKELKYHPEEHWSVPDFPFEHVPCRCSRHHRRTQGSIIVFHSFLDLRKALRPAKGIATGARARSRSRSSQRRAAAGSSRPM
jgi:hypothetical protein